VPLAYLNQLMKRQRLAAVHAQVLLKVGLHQRHGFVMRTDAHHRRRR